MVGGEVLCGGDGEQRPAVGNPDEGVHATVGERNPRSDDEVGHGPRDEDLPGLCQRRDGRGDIQWHSIDAVAALLHLARVHARARRDIGCGGAVRMASAQRMA